VFIEVLRGFLSRAAGALARALARTRKADGFILVNERYLVDFKLVEN